VSRSPSFNRYLGARGRISPFEEPVGFLSRQSPKLFEETDALAKTNPEFEGSVAGTWNFAYTA